MCSGVQTKMLTHPESSRKKDNNSIHWYSYCSQQEPALRNSFKTVFLFLLEEFSPFSPCLQLASVAYLTEFALQFELTGSSDCCHSNTHEYKCAEVMPSVSAGRY